MQAALVFLRGRHVAVAKRRRIDDGKEGGSSSKDSDKQTRRRKPTGAAGLPGWLLELAKSVEGCGGSPVLSAAVLGFAVALKKAVRCDGSRALELVQMGGGV